ncbi:MAG: 4Fe-4S binding protein [Clostridiaceae bacterium]|nr:4Fe-4S binding protein [Clostridiaceae bacterium]
MIDLDRRKQNYLEKTGRIPSRIIVCAGTGCVANGSRKVHDALADALRKRGLDVVLSFKDDHGDVLISRSGCQGFCQIGPLVTILPEGILYTHVKPQDAEEIVQTTLVEKRVVDRLVFREPDTGAHTPISHDIGFYKRQSRTTLKLSGYIDAEEIDEYIADNGYFAARRAFLEMDGAAVCQFIMESGLRGRGGGGFPTARKWELTRMQPEPKKYVICNGDEGDPGAFMDRSLMEGNPHAVIEGMLIAARAIGADEGYVYVRAEYPLAVERMKKAVQAALDAGILGRRIFGSTMDFDIHVMEGAGAFVCGEETALIASIEGNRGMPSPKPPFPAQSGLFKKPTVINNVETLATIPVIFAMGAPAYASIGTATSKGTKTFALTGHVANTGLIEVPFGTTLRTIVNDIGGGVINDDGTRAGCDFKAVQIGGPSGGCLTQEHLDLPIDYENLKAAGAMVGSGGLVVMNQQTCMVSIARFFMQFTQNESCGKCVVCREGTKQMLALLDDIIEGRADEKTIPLLEELALVVQKGSLCGLGKTAPNPVLSTLKYFRDEYEAHVFQKTCPTGRCKSLAKYRIIEDKCRGCSLCARKCPVGAITGELKKPYHIDQQACIKCGACMEACKFAAVTIG